MRSAAAGKAQQHPGATAAGVVERREIVVDKLQRSLATTAETPAAVVAAAVAVV